MRLIGASVEGRRTLVLDDVLSAFEAGRPFVLVSTGEDVTGVFAEGKETSAEVVRTAHRFVPELAQ